MINIIILVKIIKRTTYDKNTNTSKTSYQILTMNNVNTFDHYKGLPNAEDKLETVYTNPDSKKALNEAFAAANWLKYNVPKQDVFQFNTDDSKPEKEGFEEFTTGEVVIDGDGNRYSVESTKANVDNHGNLWVKNLQTKKDEFIPKGKFYENKWQRSSDEKITLSTTKKMTRLPVNEPLQLFPFDPKLQPGQPEDDRDPVTKRVEQERLRDNATVTLQKLDPEAKDNLELRIVKGEEFEAMQAIDPKKREVYPKIGKNPENKNIRKGAPKYYTVIYGGKNKDVPMFVLQDSHTTTLLDKNGNKINPLLITQKQAEDLFILKGGKNADGKKGR